MKISIINNLSHNSIFFLRGKDITGIYLDSDYKDNIVNNVKYDCTGKQNPYYCVPLPNRTFFFHIKSGKQQDLYLKDEDKINSGVVWYSPDGAKKITSGGPEKQAEAEFTITTGDHPVVSYDLTFVEAISCGVRMTYTPEGGNPVEVMCKPDKPSKLKIDNSLGYPTILSDKYQGSSDDKKYAGCASDLADTVCGQHKCRAYMANLYKDPDSYCGWLNKNKCQGYCWGMDEWMCTDERCGYGDHPDWPKDCSVFNKNMGAASNVPSCGKGKMKGIDGKTYWGNGNLGCIDKEVDGKPTNPNIPRNGGTFTMEFINLPWISGKPTPHGGGGDSGGGGSNVSAVIIIILIVVAFLATLFGIYWKFLR